jgi:Domain of unknown function (DUF4399)
MSLIPIRTLGASTALICLITAGAAAQGTQGQPAAAQAASAPATPRTPAPHDAYVYIGWPLDGAIVNGSHIKVWFGTRNFGVAPAGVAMRNTGHHHLLIDVPVPPLDQPIPNDRNHLHFGLGQTETVIELPPGKHTLQLLMGDADHVPHDPALMSKRITIYVRD